MQGHTRIGASRIPHTAPGEDSLRGGPIRDTVSAASARTERPDLVWSGAAPDKRVEHLPHRFWVAAHNRGGGLDVAGGIKVLPGEREPGATGELREEGPLRPSVALAERVQGVDLAQVIGQPLD